jgi:hypothetical protein
VARGCDLTYRSGVAPCPGRDGTSRLGEAGPLEIACDESGSEGERLIGGSTDVFAHASLHLGAGVAAACIQRLRVWTRSPAEEYKASVVLRAQNRPALMWLLGPSGPLHGNAHVHLTEKTYLVVGAVADILTRSADAEARQDPLGGSAADRLYREGPRAVGQGRWMELLASFNDLVRATDPAEMRAYAAAFSRLGAGLRQASTESELVLRLGRWSADSDAVVARLLEGPAMAPRLDPLIPALAHAVTHWGAGGRAVAVVHDEHHSLTAPRIAQLRQLLDGRGPSPGRKPCRLVGVRLVDSRSDPRVQVADLLAGAARRIASNELNGSGDTELTRLLRPYVDTDSIWGHERSWARLAQVHLSS